MANSLLTTSLILDRALAVLSQSPVFLNKINTQYDSKFASKGVKVGDTVSVKVPMRATIRDGRIMSIQNQTDKTIPVAIDKYKGVDTGATSLEMAMDIDSYQREFIDTKIPDLVAAVEADALSSCMARVYNCAGDFGSFNDVSTVLSAGGILDNYLAPRSNRTMLTNVLGTQSMVNALTGFYNPSAQISEQYEEGLMARNTLGFDWYQSTLLVPRTRGSANASYETATGGAALTSDLTTDISTISIDTGTGTWAVGDIFTIEGVNAVHPQTKADLGYLKQFVCRVASAGGSVTLSFSPAIEASGPGQNVSVTPGADKDVLPLGTLSTAYQQSLAFHKDAFYFVTADLPQPEGMGVNVAQKTWNGITMRFMNGFDIANDMYVSRFDIAYGAGVLRPELACRIQHTA